VRDSLQQHRIDKYGRYKKYRVFIDGRTVSCIPGKKYGPVVYSWYLFGWYLGLFTRWGGGGELFFPGGMTTLATNAAESATCPAPMTDDAKIYGYGTAVQQIHMYCRVEYQYKANGGLLDFRERCIEELGKLEGRDKCEFAKEVARTPQQQAEKVALTAQIVKGWVDGWAP